MLNPAKLEVVGPKTRRCGVIAIQAAHFDAVNYRTMLTLANQEPPLEIVL